MKIKLIVTALLLGGHLYANAQTSVSDTIRTNIHSGYITTQR